MRLLTFSGVVLPCRAWIIRFHSRWAQETILLEDCDVIKRCPACHYWPYCFWCQKCWFPPYMHRGIRKLREQPSGHTRVRKFSFSEFDSIPVEKLPSTENHTKLTLKMATLKQIYLFK